MLWYFIVVLIFNSLTYNVEHMLIFHLHIAISTLIRCLFRSFAHFKRGCLFSYWDLNAFLQNMVHIMNSGIHVFIYSATLAETAPHPPLLTEPRHCCTLGPQLKLLSISGSPAFRGGQYDRACPIKSKQKVLVGGSWKDCKGEDSVGMYLFDLLPFTHPWPFSTMWHNSQKGSSHLARRKTKSQARTAEPKSRSLRYIDSREILQKPQDCLQISCFVIRNTLSLVSISVRFLLQSIHSLFWQHFQALAPNKTTLSNFYLKDWFT